MKSFIEQAAEKKKKTFNVSRDLVSLFNLKKVSLHTVDFLGVVQLGDEA